MNEIHYASIDHNAPNELTSIDIVRKYYPALAKEGYTFYTNIEKPASEKEIKEIKLKSNGKKRFWDNNNYILTGEIFVGKNLQARSANGTIDPRLVPVFAKYKKFNEIIL